MLRHQFLTTVWTELTSFRLLTTVWTKVWYSSCRLLCLRLWPGWGGVLVWAVWFLLGNLPFILIQRYNRPRLLRLRSLLQRREQRKGRHEHTDTDL